LLALLIGATIVVVSRLRAKCRINTGIISVILQPTAHVQWNICIAYKISATCFGAVGGAVSTEM